MMRKSIRTVLALFLLAVTVRIAAPFMTEWYVNETLAELPDYWGHVEDVDLSLWRFGASVEGFVLVKRGSAHRDEPMVEVARAAIWLHPQALLDGKVVGDARIVRPAVHLIRARREANTQLTVPKTIAEQLEALVYLDVGRIRVEDGQVRFKDLTTSPPVDLRVDEIYLTAYDLKTRPSESDRARPSRVDFEARVQDKGRLRVDASADMFAQPHPAVQGDMRLESLPLTELNDFAKAYAAIDFSAGHLALFSEVAIANKRIEGYLKPLISGEDVADLEDDAVPEVAWEAFMGAMMTLLDNPTTDAVATRIPIDGTLDDPDIGVWPMAGRLFTNALLQAVLPRVDDTISLADLSESTE